MRAGDGDHGFVESGSLGDVVGERAEHGSGRDELAEGVARDAEPLEQVGRPGARARVETLGGGRVRALAHRDAAEPEVEQVGDEQQRIGRLERRPPASTSAASWKIVLNGMSWMPVRS